MKAAYMDRDFDACGLRAGRLCEVLLRYAQEQLTGNFTPFTDRLGNFSEECAKLEQTPRTSGPDSLRVLLPRALNFAFALRNKRDIGHEGGEVDANEIDAASMVRVMDWCLSEIIRVSLAVPIEDAQAVLDAIAERQLPLVWAAPGGRKRVLAPGLRQADQALILLYGDVNTAVPIEDLADWVGATRLDHFRSRVVLALHARRLVEFDVASRTVILTPLGSVRAEALLSGLADGRGDGRGRATE